MKLFTTSISKSVFFFKFLVNLAFAWKASWGLMNMKFDIWYLTSNFWLQIFVIWCLLSDIWHLTFKIWHYTSDIWLLTSDNNLVVWALWRMKGYTHRLKNQQGKQLSVGVSYLLSFKTFHLANILFFLQKVGKIVFCGSSLHSCYSQSL